MPSECFKFALLLIHSIFFNTFHANNIIMIYFNYRKIVIIIDFYFGYTSFIE